MKQEIVERLNELLDTYFLNIGKKFDELRTEQIGAISDILEQRDVMVVMPTAGGKSLCFQLPALYWKDSVTIVISPLRALIRDQVREINRHGEVATIIGSRSTMDLYYEEQDYETKQQRKERMNGIINGTYRLVYITPEMLTNTDFLRVIRRIRTKVKMIAVDEAHCVSMWGYSFRPSYLKVRNFIASFSERPIVAAFTATATKTVVLDTVRTLNLKLKEEPLLNPSVYDRKDLCYHVMEITKKADESETAEERERAIGYRKGQKVVGILKKYVEAGEQGLIFCATPKEVESIYTYLDRPKTGFEGKLSRYYSGDMSDEERKKNLDAFLQKETFVMVATNAFGMGINMPGIRFVIHYNIPLCLENYCQETGRAARGEGVRGDCYLLYAKGDERICRALISKNPYPDRRKMAQERFRKMVEYAKKGDCEELTDEVLHERIRNYFTNPEDGEREESETKGGERKENETKGNERKESETKGNERKESRKNGRKTNAVAGKGNLPLYVNRTYVANEIRKGVFENERLLFRGTKSYVSYRLYDMDTGERASLSYFDLMVADAVYSLWLYNRPITHKSIWILLSGNAQVSVQKEKKEKIWNSLRKMSKVGIRIEQHLKGEYGFYLEDEEQLETLEGTFLDFEQLGFNSKESLVLKSIPPLYLYAELQGQFHIFDSEQLCIRLVEPAKTPEGKEAWGKYQLKRDSDGNEMKMQSSIGNTMLKHYLLRRMDLINAPGIEQKVVKEEKTGRAKSPQKKKRQGVLSNKINYYSEEGESILERLGLIASEEEGEGGYSYKYKYKRFHEEMLGAGIPRKRKEKDGQKVFYEPAGKEKKKPRMEQMLDYYIWLAQEKGIGTLSGYESRVHEEEIVFGKKQLYTQICLDVYPKKSKREYKVEEGKRNKGAKNDSVKNELK